MPHNMVSMKKSKAEMKEGDHPASLGDEEYSYGLEISLDTDSLEKLGIKTLPEVGSEMLMMAKVKVTSISENTREGEEPYKSVGLQITDMNLKLEDNRSPEEVIFGKKEINAD